ncbi:MAG: DEAD/DEAH box helicase [Deltaproteobacteria bacterium]|nr:DEAD/DEAH box helicase [Deltaproteobacteria bacterium]
MPHRRDYGHRHRGKDRQKTAWTSEFQELDLPASVMDGIRDAAFTEMTPIQRQALPILLEGGDLMGQAQTGTGKTATFLLAIFAGILREGGHGERDPLALILSPTRELAIQTHKEAQLLGKHTGLRAGIYYGGKDYRKQEASLDAGIDLAIGTPGRLLDFMRRGQLRLGRVRFLVIDEADRLLDLGFYEELTAILRRLPPKEKRQSLVFSATLDQRAQKLARQYLARPASVEIEPENITAEGINEMLFHVEREMKVRLLLGLLAREDVPKGLIFANTKIVAGFLAEKLRRNGYQCALLTGDLPQNKRLRVLEEFTAGRVRLLVASDVASRGLHIDDVTHIVNFDVPQDPEDYVHRIGRTARAGKTGTAYTLACDEYVYHLPDIEAYIKRSIPFEHADERFFGKDQAEDFDIRAFKRQERSSRGPRREGGGGRQRGSRRR